MDFEWLWLSNKIETAWSFKLGLIYTEDENQKDLEMKVGEFLEKMVERQKKMENFQREGYFPRINEEMIEILFKFFFSKRKTTELLALASFVEQTQVSLSKKLRIKIHRVQILLEESSEKPKRKMSLQKTISSSNEMHLESSGPSLSNENGSGAKRKQNSTNQKDLGCQSNNKRQKLLEMMGLTGNQAIQGQITCEKHSKTGRMEIENAETSLKRRKSKNKMEEESSLKNKSGFSSISKATWSVSEKLFWAEKRMNLYLKSRRDHLLKETFEILDEVSDYQEEEETSYRIKLCFAIQSTQSLTNDYETGKLDQESFEKQTLEFLELISEIISMMKSLSFITFSNIAMTFQPHLPRKESFVSNIMTAALKKLKSRHDGEIGKAVDEIDKLESELIKIENTAKASKEKDSGQKTTSTRYGMQSSNLLQKRNNRGKPTSSFHNLNRPNTPSGGGSSKSWSDLFVVNYKEVNKLVKRFSVFHQMLLRVLAISLDHGDKPTIRMILDHSRKIAKVYEIMFKIDGASFYIFDCLLSEFVSSDCLKNFITMILAFFIKFKSQFAEHPKEKEPRELIGLIERDYDVSLEEEMPGIPLILEEWSENYGETTRLFYHYPEGIAFFRHALPKLFKLWKELLSRDSLLSGKERQMVSYRTKLARLGALRAKVHFMLGHYIPCIK